MFCNQCEQARGGFGCQNGMGMCGKSADVQSLQELILYGVKGMETDKMPGLEQRDGNVYGIEAAPAAQILRHVLTHADRAVHAAKHIGPGRTGVGAIRSEGHIQGGPGKVHHSGAGRFQSGLEQQL